MAKLGDYEFISMLILFVGCVLMLVSHHFRRQAWAPWGVLLGTCIVLLVIAYNILRQANINYF